MTKIPTNFAACQAVHDLKVPAESNIDVVLDDLASAIENDSWLHDGLEEIGNRLDAKITCDPAETRIDGNEVKALTPINVEVYAPSVKGHRMNLAKVYRALAELLEA